MLYSAVIIRLVTGFVSCDTSTFETEAWRGTRGSTSKEQVKGRRLDNGWLFFVSRPSFSLLSLRFCDTDSLLSLILMFKMCHVVIFYLSALKLLNYGQEMLVVCVLLGTSLKIISCFELQISYLICRLQLTVVVSSFCCNSSMSM